MDKIIKYKTIPFGIPKPKQTKKTPIWPQSKGPVTWYIIMQFIDETATTTIQ